MPALRLSPLARSSSGSPARDFSPIYNGLPAHTAADPFGLLPWLRRIRRERTLILQWNNEKKALEIWHWPVLNNARVPPSELNDLRKTHRFSGPSCLCASQSPDPAAVTEAAMFLVTTGRLAGEYVAACARGKCKYWAFLERLYNRRGLAIRSVEERPIGSTVPDAIEYIPEEEAEERVVAEMLTNSQTSSSSSGTTSGNISTPTQSQVFGPPYTQAPLERARARIAARRGAETRVKRRRLDDSTLERPTDIDPFIIPIPAADPPRPSTSTTPLSLLLALDNERDRGGITEEQFRGLFIKCRRCKRIMTRRIFKYHKQCPPITDTEVIDLTADTD